MIATGKSFGPALPNMFVGVANRASGVANRADQLRALPLFANAHHPTLHSRPLVAAGRPLCCLSEGCTASCSSSGHNRQRALKASSPRPTQTLPGGKRALVGTERVMCLAKKKSADSEGDGILLDDSEPWLGAVVFTPVTGKRSYVFLTTLERLGLADLSSGASAAAAASLQPEGMEGKAASLQPEGMEGGASEGDGTLVVIRMGVKKVRKDLVAEGSVETVFGLQCTRCLAPTLYDVDTTYQLLLSAIPVMEPTLRSMGVVLGDKRWDSEDMDEIFLDGQDGAGSNTGLLDLDLDDKIYFPLNRASVDLSKYFRDTVHLELPLKLLCREDCKGICFNCGVDLNKKGCACNEEDLFGGGLEGGGSGKGKGSMAEQIQAQLKKKQKGW